MSDLIRLPAHAIYRPDRIIRLLADSPLKNLGEEECYRYLLHVHGIDRYQIKGNFQTIRIKAHNIRAARICEKHGSKAKPFTPSTVPTGTVSSRVVDVEHSGSPLQLYRDAS
ncbi:hypothetical protein [Microvirga sp. P5_D2]